MSDGPLEYNLGTRKANKFFNKMSHQDDMGFEKLGYFSSKLQILPTMLQY